MTASDAHFTFPSPVGELHFSMQLKRSLMIILGFRPLSGNYISQSVFMDLDRIARGRVSVPCRGTTFLNMVQITLSLMKHTEFPSPVGELHFSIPSLQSRHQSGLMVGIAWEKYFWKNK